MTNDQERADFLDWHNNRRSSNQNAWAAWQARAALAAPAQAVPASGPVGFDHKTAANFLNGKTVADEEVRLFVAHSRWAHDDRDWLRNTIADLRREIARRDAEIALLKTSLLDAEALQPAAQAQAALVIAEAALADIGDADREPGDDVAWCEARAAQALPEVRAALITAAPQPAAQALEDAVAQAVAAEREACAQVCEVWADEHDYAGAIRARGTDAS